MTQSDLIEIGLSVAEIASEIFERCGATDDYCIQGTGLSIVFGGTNRLIFSAKYGWRADRSYCTPRFLEAWDQIKHEYKEK